MPFISELFLRFTNDYLYIGRTAQDLDPKKLITHHFKLGDILKAYDTFGDAGREHALKVILTGK